MCQEIQIFVQCITQDLMSKVKQELTNKHDISWNMSYEVSGWKSYTAAQRHCRTSWQSISSGAKWVFGIYVPTHVLGLEVAHTGQQVRDGGPGGRGSVFSARCVRLDVWSGVGWGGGGQKAQISSENRVWSSPEGKRGLTQGQQGLSMTSVTSKPYTSSRSTRKERSPWGSSPMALTWSAVRVGSMLIATSERVWKMRLLSSMKNLKTGEEIIASIYTNDTSRGLAPAAFARQKPAACLSDSQNEKIFLVWCAVFAHLLRVK